MKKNNIANSKLHIEQLKEDFKSRESFTTKEGEQFYRKLEPQVKITTVNWRIYSLVQMGVITRTGRGKLSIGTRKIFLPEISKKLKSVYNQVRKEFPYSEICVWNTAVFNEFMNHQPGRFFILVEVEKEAMEAVFLFLKEKKYPVFIEPDEGLAEKYFPDQKEIVIVKPLVSEAPLQKINKLNTVTLEKMLVDIFCDKVVFSAQQGSEMRTIFGEAMNKYETSENRMVRYADRRGRKKQFLEYLNSISKLRQQTRFTAKI